MTPFLRKLLGMNWLIFGLAIVLENGLFEYFGADIRSLAPYVGSLSYDSFGIGGSYIGELAILTFVAAIVLLGGLQLFLTYTPLGRQIRAHLDDHRSLGGLDQQRVLGVFVIGQFGFL